MEHEHHPKVLARSVFSNNKKKTLGRFYADNKLK